MALRVAACPRCKGPLVFGERICRACGQTFQYGAAPPPAPTLPQIAEALAAAGLAPPPGMAPPPAATAPPKWPPTSSSQPGETSGSTPRWPPTSSSQPGETSGSTPRWPPSSSSPPAAPTPKWPPTSTSQPGIAARAPAQTPQAQMPQSPGRPSTNPFGSEIDHGRFEDVGDVEIDHPPGFLDSGIFKMFTPIDVQSTPMFGLDDGRFAEVGNVQPAFTPGLEQTPRDAVGEVFTQPVSGIFHSDVFHTDAEVPTASTAAMDGFEPSPSAPRPPPKTEPAPKKRAPTLGTIMCRCGERHRLPRCPACGTAHPDA